MRLEDDEYYAGMKKAMKESWKLGITLDEIAAAIAVLTDSGVWRNDAIQEIKLALQKSIREAPVKPKNR